jgi:hypothetical protein
MANALSGTAGSVVFMTGGTTTVGAITEWSLDLSHSPVETTAFGDGWQTYIPSIRNATGSFSGNFYDSDTAQSSLNASMLAGSAIALRLYVSGTKYYNVGTAYLTGQGVSISNDGKAENSYDFQVSGPVTFV